jgi:hypothetical protein
VILFSAQNDLSTDALALGIVKIKLKAWVCEKYQTIALTAEDVKGTQTWVW